MGSPIISPEERISAAGKIDDALYVIIKVLSFPCRSQQQRQRSLKEYALKATSRAVEAEDPEQGKHTFQKNFLKRCLSTHQVLQICV